MGELFDAYIMVDWSAANTPKTGADSIWISALEQTDQGLLERALINSPTRKEAFEDLCDLFSDFQARGIKTLVGFDFSFGYPTGFAQKLGLSKQNWTGVWQEIARFIEDSEKNANNRFQVADLFNTRIGVGPGPFWGHPVKQSYENLTPKKPTSGQVLSQKRICEERTPGVKPVWQLLGTGCVGSQTLMGIAWLQKIYSHPWFQNDLQVWPFETGLQPLVRADLPSLTLCEIYPSQIKLNLKDGDIKDREQVLSMARHYARLDDQGELAALFEGDMSLSLAEKDICVQEEGWVLGIGASARQKADHWMTTYLRSPNEIYRKSEEMIREKIDVSRVHPDFQEVVIRMVHSIGEPEIMDHILFSEDAAHKGQGALQRGCPIFVDVEMVAHGIIKKRLPAQNNIRCHLNDRDVPALAQKGGTTRSAAALEKWGADLAGAVVVIGNAPTALFHLLGGLKDKRFAKPALVIGCPVGFVGAAESKDCLIEYANELDLPYITIKGQRGGSALAAAALNGLAKKGIVQ